MFYISIVIGLGCGIIASLMAFVITWNEYQRHQFERKHLLRISLQAAGTTFVVFLFSAILIGYLLLYFIL